MNNKIKDNHFDAIIVGSGTCGATIAMELSRQKKKVLIIERGGNTPLKESLWGIASIVDEVPVSDNMKEMHAITTGGSTAIYFAVADLPPLDTFLSLGIDLSEALEDVRKEQPIEVLPDELLGTQVLKLRESAEELGYSCKKNLMQIDQSKCPSGYSYEAKWKARSYVQEAIKEGATLINRATVFKVLVEKKQAIGVEYKLRKGIKGSEICQVFGTKIILAAGALASPKILRNSGMKDVGNRGFYCQPAFALYGIIPRLKGKENFMGSTTIDFEDGISLGDGNLHRFLYRLLMLGKLKPKHLFSYTESIGVGVKIKDVLGGELREDGRYYKQLTEEDYKKLKKGEEAAIKILKNAGAKNIFNVGIDATGVGGLIRIQEHVDERLQTEYENLHVCDGSVMPGNTKVAPNLTLICLGKYLAKQLQ